jgi:exosome complex component RRP42
MQEIVSRVKRDYIADLAQQGKRADARSLDQYREISVEPGWAETAEGSAMAKIGNTQVLAGVKLQKGEPYPDRPESGVLIVNAELVPLASPTFEPGPPKENAIELARVVDRGIRESEAIDLDELVVTPGEEVWMAFVDIHVLDQDGNLIDTSALAAVSALWNVKPPEDEGWKLQRFPISKKPVTTTMAKINDRLMVDPCLDEESVMDARISMATTDDGNLCAMQKGGTGTLTLKDIDEAYELVRAKAGELRKHI